MLEGYRKWVIPLPTISLGSVILIQVLDGCWNEGHRLDTRMCHLGLRRGETCRTCNSGYNYTLGFSEKWESPEWLKTELSLLQKEIDTLPKVSSILWYMGHIGWLCWTLIINFHFPYRLLNHFNLDQWPERNPPTLYVSIWGHLLWLMVEGSWPLCVNSKSWDCAKEEKDVQDEEKWTSSLQPWN